MLRKNEGMCEVLLEIMCPKVKIIAKEREKKGKTESTAKALANMILKMKQKGFSP